VPAVRRKEQLNISISPLLKRKLEALVRESNDFASVSDLCQYAIQEFLIRYEHERAIKQEEDCKPFSPKEELGGETGYE